MKEKIWLIHGAIILTSLLAFWVCDDALQGRLKNKTLFNHVSPPLKLVAGLFRDLKFQFRGKRTPKQNIFIVDIDSSSLSTIGRWPWRRDYTYELIRKTFEAGAKIVGLDMFFSEPQESIPEELKEVLTKKGMEKLTWQFDFDTQLASIFAKYEDRLVVGWGSESLCKPAYDKAEVCLVSHPEALSDLPPHFDKFAFNDRKFETLFDKSQTPIVSIFTILANIPLFTDVLKHSGFVIALKDRDGMVRNTSLVIMADGQPHPSFALEIAKLARNEKLSIEIDHKHRVKSIRFVNSNEKIPVTPLGVASVNYRGGEQSFPYISALDVLKDEDIIEDSINRQLTGLSKTKLLEGAIALIGTSALANFDRIATPFGTDIPGVEVHATILDNILSKEVLTYGIGNTGFWILLLILVFGGSAFSYYSWRLQGYRPLILFVTVFTALALIDLFLFSRYNQDWNTAFIHLEFTGLTLTTMLIRYLVEERKKNFLRTAFSKYVAPAVVDSLIQNPDELSIGGKKQRLTVLFSDIRSFTSFSETVDAHLLSQFLSDYFTVMTAIIFKNQGTLDKFIGDAIMAFWGAPVYDKLHAEKACRTAMEMSEAVKEHHDRFKKQYGIEVKIGVGLTSGIMNVGNMGSEKSFSYTVIGDNVNLASRLEGATKSFGATILTTQTTLEEIDSQLGAVPPHLSIGSVKVKGKENAVEVVQLLNQPIAKQGIKLFEKAKILYCKRQWDQAIQKFVEANKHMTVSGIALSGVCEAYKTRCRLCAEREPGPEWDGSWSLEK